MAVDAAQADPSVDAIIVILTPQAMTQPARDRAGHRRQGDAARSPLLASFMGGEDVMPGREELVAANLPDYPSPERAVAALKAMCDYAAWRRRPPRIVARFPVNRRRVERIIARQLRTGRLYRWAKPKAKEILRAYDFIVPDGRLATTRGRGGRGAPTRSAIPVAMKIVSPDIVHKSDIGRREAEPQQRRGRRATRSSS